MRVIQNIAMLKTLLAEDKQKSGLLGLVPTMGALHQGHLCLIKHAKQTCQRVIVSIFVNQKQFDDVNDFNNYPRCLEQDLDLLKAQNIDYVFAPSDEEMWPAGNQTYVEVEFLSKILLGELRPNHFRGVASVVAKLLNLCQPDKAFFGEKDFQQLAIIRQMVKDLAFPVEIVGVPTLREADGVAASSRNQLLTAQQRKAAPVIGKALDAAQRAYHAGERQVSALYQCVEEVLKRETLAQIESIEIRDLASLEKLETDLDRPAVILIVVKFGSIRLLDERILESK